MLNANTLSLNTDETNFMQFSCKNSSLTKWILLIIIKYYLNERRLPSKTQLYENNI